MLGYSSRRVIQFTDALQWLRDEMMNKPTPTVCDVPLGDLQ